MTLDEKIGQLFIIPASPAMGGRHRKELLDCIDRYKVGGIILKATSIDHRAWLGDFDSSMLICIDAEWGLGMRMSDQISFPRNLTLGAIQDSNLIYELGVEIGKQIKNFGAHVNLAPVVDVNNNPNNPIIHTRSFGEDPALVSEKAALIKKGMQDSGTFTCLKHFPGHGDTGFDSHLELPMIEHDLDHLEKVELAPYKELILQGVDLVMTAHLLFPRLDVYPATLSKKIVQGLLKDKLQYKGLIITDALNMKALTNHYTPEEIALLAHEAGHDLLLYGDHIAPNIDDILQNHIPKAFQALKSAYLSGKLSVKDLDKTVQKILEQKQKMQKLPYDPNYDFSYAQELKHRLYRQAITLVKGQIPTAELSNRSFAYLQIDDNGSDKLASSLGVKKSEVFHLPIEGSKSARQAVYEKIEGFDTALISISTTKPLSSTFVEEFKDLSRTHRLVVVFFGSPYHVKGLDVDTLLLGYEQDEVAYEEMAKILKGEHLPRGQLPVTVDLN